MVAAIMFVGVSASAGTGEGPGKKAPVKKEVKKVPVKETAKPMFAPIYFWNGTTWTTTQPIPLPTCNGGSVRCTFEITDATPSQYRSEEDAISVVEANLNNLNSSNEVLDAAHSNLNTPIILLKKSS